MTPVSSYQELMNHQARAAVAVSRAHHSSWNNEVRRLPEGLGKTRALARWDGTLEYRDDLTQTLRELFAKAGRHQPQADLERYRDALGVVLHENTHLLAARGTSHSMAYQAFQHNAVAVFDEAVTEAYKQVALDKYIDELGLERIAPGLKDVRCDRTYPQFVPAAQVFANAVGRRCDLSGDEVLRRLAVVNAEGKYRVAAELVYQSSELPNLVPHNVRHEAVSKIAAGMQGPFEQIHDYDPDDPSDLALSALAGAAADRGGYRQVRELTAYWSTRQDLRRSLDLGLGTTPPRASGAGTQRDPATNSATEEPGRPSKRLSRRDQTICRPIDRD